MITPISDDKKTQFKLTHPHLVECAICQNPLYGQCPECLSKTTTKCVWITGKCGHVYHDHCITQTLKTKKYCPLDNSIWSPLNKCLSLVELTCLKLIKMEPSILINLYYNYELPSKVWDLILQYSKELRPQSKLNKDDKRVISILYNTACTQLVYSEINSKIKEMEDRTIVGLSVLAGAAFLYGKSTATSNSQHYDSTYTPPCDSNL